MTEQSINEQSINEQQDAFWQLVERLVELANQAPEELALTEVGGALLVAAARFNAYALAASSLDQANFQEDRRQALSDYTGQFKQLLADDLDDYDAHYAQLIGNKAPADD